MQQTELAAILKYLDQITGATNDGKMVWIKANPSTYVYNAESPRGRVILQKMHPAPPYYSLQVVGATTNDIKLEVNGMESGNQSINQNLNVLFGAIEKFRDVKGLEFLKSLLPS